MAEAKQGIFTLDSDRIIGDLRYTKKYGIVTHVAASKTTCTRRIL